MKSSWLAPYELNYKFVDVSYMLNIIFLLVEPETVNLATFEKSTNLNSEKKKNAYKKMHENKELAEIELVATFAAENWDMACYVYIKFDFGTRGA